MGTYTTDDALTQVYRRLRDFADTADEQLLTDTEIEDQVRQATTRYSTDRPNELAADIDTDGTRYLTLPADFEDGFSVIRGVEWPIDADLPSYLDPRWLDFYRTPAVTGPPAVAAALKLRCLAWTIPAGTAVVRMVYTGRRTLGATAADTTVLDRDFDALCDLAVAGCCDVISQEVARLHEPPMGLGGTVAPRDKADVWASRAKRYEARYRDAMGPTLASARVNWDSTASWPTGTWLNHPRFRR